MDKYEQEFRERINKSAKEMKVDRVELGELRFKRLVAMLYLLLQEKAEAFDLLVFGGNSGVVAMEITKMVYKAISVSLPPTALFPVVRPSNEDRVRFDEDFIKEQLENVKQVSRVLFVDDEIMKAQTAKICFETIHDFLGEPQVDPCLSCTIVAENHNFVWRYDLKGISVRFWPFATVLQGYNGNFGYLIPEDLINKLGSVLGEPIDRNQALAVLIGGKRKLVKDKVALFDHEIEKKMLSRIEGYSKARQSFMKRIEMLVKAGIQEYQTGAISFRHI